MIAFRVLGSFEVVEGDRALALEELQGHPERGLALGLRSRGAENFQAICLCELPCRREQARLADHRWAQQRNHAATARASLVEGQLQRLELVPTLV